MDKLLALLDSNARLTDAQLAVMLGTSETDVKKQIAKLEQDGVIRAYKAVIDWDRTDRDYVTAIIELRVTPKRDLGFEAIAETIMRFSRAMPSFPSQLEWKIGLAWANTRGILNSPS